MKATNQPLLKTSYRNSQQGMVTVELACSLVTVVFIICAAVALVACLADYIRAVDAAGEIAKAAARGDVPSSLSPPHAKVSVDRDTDQVRVIVTPLRTRRALWPIPAATAYAAVEPGVGNSGGNGGERVGKNE